MLFRNERGHIEYMPTVEDDPDGFWWNFRDSFAYLFRAMHLPNRKEAGEIIGVLAALLLIGVVATFVILWAIAGVIWVVNQ
jgi:hypothetical protein